MTSQIINNPKRKSKSKLKIAAFGAGCFWGVEYTFSKFDGILETKVGYMGGNFKSPAYHDVCYNNTGHAETVRIKYNENLISYNKLLDIFFKCHNPASINRQGPDIGNQYRSVIFYYTEKQKEIAEKKKKEYEKILKKEIVTEIKKAGKFYEAEGYHQKYYENIGSEPYCHTVPKV